MRTTHRCGGESKGLVTPNVTVTVTFWILYKLCRVVTPTAPSPSNGPLNGMNVVDPFLARQRDDL